MHEEKLPIMQHLHDLRTSLTRSIAGIVVASVVCYLFSEHILYMLRRPMLAYMPEGFSFVVLSPYEYFFTELKAGVFLGLVVSCPWVFYQIWRFVSPGLYDGEKKALGLFVVLASVLFVVGVLFAYLFVFPAAFEFFIGTIPEGVKGFYSIGLLYGFAMSVMIAFGVVFQTPVAVFLLVFFDLISLDTIKEYRRVIFVMAFVVGAILTPPDPLTQIMLAVPTYLLFEAGLLVATLTLKRKAQVATNQQNA